VPLVGPAGLDVGVPLGVDVPGCVVRVVRVIAGRD